MLAPRLHARTACSDASRTLWSAEASHRDCHSLFWPTLGWAVPLLRNARMASVFRNSASRTPRKIDVQGRSPPQQLTTSGRCPSSDKPKPPSVVRLTHPHCCKHIPQRTRTSRPAFSADRRNIQMCPGAARQRRRVGCVGQTWARVTFSSVLHQFAQTDIPRARSRVLDPPML